MRATTFAAMLGAGVILAGCMQAPVTGDAAAAAGPRPDNYREIVAQNLRQTLFDPYSVRDAAISEPRVHRAMVGPRWNVCFRGNAKNRFGAYTGLSYIVFVIESGQVTASATDGAALSCQGAVFSPFPELTR